MLMKKPLRTEPSTNIPSIHPTPPETSWRCFHFQELLPRSNFHPTARPWESRQRGKFWCFFFPFLCEPKWHLESGNQKKINTNNVLTFVFFFGGKSYFLSVFAVTNIPARKKMGVGSLANLLQSLLLSSWNCVLLCLVLHLFGRKISFPWCCIPFL